MSFKKIRHTIGRWLGIRKYLAKIEPGETLNLNKLLGAGERGYSEEGSCNTAARFTKDCKIAPVFAADCTGRPVVTMSSFGSNGRFGNQLFQYTFLRLVARRQGASLQLPLWAGTALFNLDEANHSYPMVLTINEKDRAEVEIAKLFQGQSIDFVDTDFNGYFMMHTSHYAPEKDFIRECFIFDRRVCGLFEDALAELGLRKKKIIAIHLRRGDYGYDQFYRAPCAWYQQWIKDQGYSPDEYIIYICSEVPDQYRDRFPGFTVLTVLDLRCPGELAPYVDFLAITLADVVAISNSSFSFFASMLNKAANGYFRPDFTKSGLTQFDPWNAQPLIDAKLSPAEHKYLKSID